MTLLIVDDEIYTIQGILDRVNWQEHGFDQVLTANSYSQAVNIIISHNVDVLLSDIEMPHGSGLDLVKWVKEHSPETECVFLTCHDDFNYAKHAINMKCLDYVLKPASKTVLDDVLRKAVNTVEQKRKDETYKRYGKQYIENIKEHSGIEKKEDVVEKTESYIRDHISESLTVEQLAKMVFLSSDHLTRLFKKKHGITVIDYITQQRLTLAKELLEQNDLSISSVAATVGYSDYSYFAKIFKKTFGVTPREWQSRSR